ncbi:MAG: class I SAM-dependent methyltransferase [Candidatus Chisholmbacteria bacterium]|nr:class I SAM-dependent methyltransferase [Candidatus Chisholmbacteria bacterium]
MRRIKRRQKRLSLRLKDFPFHIGMQDSPRVLDFPSSLPFTLAFDNNLGVIGQRVTPKVNYWLNKGYEFGGPGSTPLDKGTFSQKRSGAIVNALSSSLGSGGVVGRSFLEIGCGSGYLLYLLKQGGAKRCLGIEPGPLADWGSKKYKIEIKREFYEPGKITEKFDVVYTTCVLEHISRPLTFLRGLKACVKPGGILFTAVPNCELGLSLGDLGLLAHQHVAYFTRRSLRQLYRKLGFETVDFTTTGYGWLLYMRGKLPLRRMRSGRVLAKDVAEEKKLFRRLTRLIPLNLTAIQERIDRLENHGSHLGVYGAYPFLLQFRWKHKPRFFDTDTAKHGKYFFGHDIPVETPAVLKKKPIDALFVAPINHDKEIRQFLKKDLRFNPKNIISLKSLYEAQRRKLKT